MMTDTMSKAGLYAKMAAVMGELNKIPKTGTNEHFKYKFVTADAVADQVRELLAAKQIAFFASITGKTLLDVGKVTDAKTGDIRAKQRWVVDFAFTFADGESGATETMPWSAEADAADDKGINKCATAAEKYFLLKTFIVSSADEPDADADGARKRPQGAQNAQKGQPPPQRPQNAPAGVVGAQNGISPKEAVSKTTPPTSTSADGASSAKADLFPDEPPAVEGAVVVKLPPQIGTIDMQALGKRAFDEKLVHGRNHFADLMTKMVAEGWIRDAMNADAVLEAIKEREAKKALEAEGASV